MSNAPNEDPEDLMARYELQRAQQRGHAEKRVAYLCRALRFLGVKTVTVTFDAYGDEGSIKEAVFEPPLQDHLPFGLLEALDYNWTSFRTTGWGWNFSPNAGLDGTITIDVMTGEVVELFEAADVEREME